jgi:adenylosuccinate lyase
MGTHVIDSLLFQDQFSTKRMREIFSDENMVQKWLDVEAALAEVQAEMGIIPEKAAKEISRKARADLMDFVEMKRQVDITGHPIVPLLRCLKNACEGNAAEYAHWGATTQDIMDTGMILQVREAYGEILQKTKALQAKLCDLAKKHRDLVMAGRTHGQHALPITLGYKIAVWAAELLRDIERLEQCSRRLFMGQFSGAVGTIASLGSEGLEVQKRLMDRLRLAMPPISWHSSRDTIAEFICVLGILTSTLGKMANEVATLQKTEYGELEEPFAMGKVGSSTMPHKRNPMYSEGVVSLSKNIRSTVPLAIECMVGEHERDMRPWQAEWEFIGRVCCMTDAAVKESLHIFTDLTVRPEHIEENLYKLNGLMLSEAIMMDMGKRIGRQEAHEIVYEAAMEAFEKDIPFKEVLLRDERVLRNFEVAEIDSILDPHKYTGLAGEFVDLVTGERGISRVIPLEG